MKDYIIKYVDLTYHNPSYASDSFKMKLHFMVGFDSGRILIIPDLNFNLDFSDDTTLLYPRIFDSSIALPCLKTKIHFRGNDIFYTFQPFPYPTKFTYYAAIENAHYLLLKTCEHKESAKFINDCPVYVINASVNPFVDEHALVQFAIKEEDGSFSYYSLGDSFVSGDYRYLIEAVNPTCDTLTLVKGNIDSVLSGYTRGLSIKPFSVKSLTGDYVDLPSKNSFTLIDFWGTWCVPCIELTPQLKKIYEVFSPNIEMLSIALDSVENVREYILKNNILWSQVIESDSPLGHPVIERFSVIRYPTFVLLDQKGKILFRGSGKITLDKIQAYLEKEFNL